MIKLEVFLVAHTDTNGRNCAQLEIQATDERSARLMFQSWHEDRIITAITNKKEARDG